MINFQFFPRSHGVTPRIREIIECFKAVDKEKDASVHLKSNDMLALLKGHRDRYHRTVTNVNNPETSHI